ncbi:MAG: Exostosin family [Rhodobacteraceae bacterium HLUCCA12]|nr:MAG: Exostosin family [Rhodobacteraceae bacterium HLUCCA12]
MWAFIPDADDHMLNEERLDVALGVPRCDNKIAYVFATQGYTVLNPFPFVRSVHVHESDLRYYSKKGDVRVLGGVAYVHPGATLTEPAELDFDIWAIRTNQVRDVKLNRTLERWAEEARLAENSRPAWVAHDADWQYPAITEQHAFNRMRELLPTEYGPYDSVYLGFPFATLIDMHAQHGADHPRTRVLQAALDAQVPQLRRYKQVVTVSQHIRARQFAELFIRAGVTDLFWSHCVTGEQFFADAPSMRLHPFPLYPVQQVPRGAEDFARPRRWLFSFVGARAQKNYLTRARDMIIDLLADDPRGMVIDRDGWHYQKIVYDAQVLEKAAPGVEGLIDDTHSKAFREIMDDSVFTLCPSGSGPNSIRLWEAMVNGSIPVILSDSWAAPGDAALWEAATVRCAETAEAIAALPKRLERIAESQERLQAMREVLMKLSERYGPKGFVIDLAHYLDDQLA